MRLKNVAKLFSIMAIFVFGCCFTNVFAKKYMNGALVVADYNFVEEPGLGGTILIVKNINKEAEELGCLGMLGEFINKKCQMEKIDLRAVLTPSLNFRLSNPAKEVPDHLFISSSQGCTDFEVEYWPLKAMGLTRREGNRSIKNVFLRIGKGTSMPIMPDEIFFDKQSGRFVNREVERFIAEREAEKRLEEDERRQKEAEKRLEKAERRQKEFEEKEEERKRRQTPREQEIEELTKRRSNLKYQLAGARKRLISCQEDIVRCQRLEREKGCRLQGTLDARENEARTQRHIIDLEAAIERTEEKLAALT